MPDGAAGGTFLIVEMETGKILILTGIILLAIGLGLYLLPGFRLGRLPGDIVFRKGTWNLYLPLTSCLILSGILTLVLWLVNNLRK